ncbi:hypothetical protein [Myroides fluvii]|uniref:hypothetical protein n=1 Tax=Myroides fluvii TaxID=2572594 RepID=UPI00131CFF0E|nr:hypothetical protein [Myroides fluvii]
MKVYQTLGILGMVCLGLTCTTTQAQQKQKADLSATMPEQVKAKDLDKLSHVYAIEIENKLYSGYSLIGINPKSIEEVKMDNGIFQVGTMRFDKKVAFTFKGGYQSELVALDQWAKGNISFQGNLIYMIDGVVVNAQSSTVLLDKNYIVDYAVVPLDQMGLAEATAVVQLRMKSPANYKVMAGEKKKNASSISKKGK